MCKPIKTVWMPKGMQNLCDAVATLYLSDRKLAGDNLFITPNRALFEQRQKKIEELIDALRERRAEKAELDACQWAGAEVTESWTNRRLATLADDLRERLTNDGKQWSLRVLPATLGDTGHHVAIGSSPDLTHWWLLDPASALYVFDSCESLAKFLHRLLRESEKFSDASKTVLLRIG